MPEKTKNLKRSLTMEALCRSVSSLAVSQSSSLRVPLKQAPAQVRAFDIGAVLMLSEGLVWPRILIPAN